jgi:hypothetical protein
MYAIPRHTSSAILNLTKSVRPAKPFISLPSPVHAYADEQQSNKEKQEQCEEWKIVSSAFVKGAWHLSFAVQSSSVE